MDFQLNTAAATPRLADPGGMPPEAPLSMPTQDLRYRPYRPGLEMISSAVLYARFILISVTLGVTTYGVYQMLQAVRFANMTFLQGTMIFFFAVSLGWIAFAAGSVAAGASKRRDSKPADTPAELPLTALVMPIYNEDPTRTAAALQAMAEALERIGVHRSFEIVMVSDSTNADAWVRETLGVERLRAALRDIMPVWYRRRRQNIARKSGNL
jgi:membrane glycosyltransferase